MTLTLTRVPDSDRSCALGKKPVGNLKVLHSRVFYPVKQNLVGSVSSLHAFISVMPITFLLLLFMRSTYSIVNTVCAS
jgi:hypothetical protein